MNVPLFVRAGWSGLQKTIADMVQDGAECPLLLCYEGAELVKDQCVMPFSMWKPDTSNLRLGYPEVRLAPTLIRHMLPLTLLDDQKSAEMTRMILP